jgi:hypothetical protein
MKQNSTNFLMLRISSKKINSFIRQTFKYNVMLFKINILNPKTKEKENQTHTKFTLNICFLKIK